MKDLVVPSLGEYITEAVIGKWLVKVGGRVEADEPVVDLETDKITVQMPSPVNGALTEQKYAVGDTVRVGDIIGQVDENAKGDAPAAPAAAAPATASQAAPAPTPAAPAPAAAPAAAAAPPAPIELPERDGMGRVLSPSQRKDIRGGKAKLPSVSSSVAAVSARASHEPKVEEVVPMSPLRRRIAERLVQAQQSSASLTTFNEIDIRKDQVDAR